MDTKVIINKLETINGQFYPGQMGSRLFMDTNEMDEKYLVEFHERFHYHQNIFTPYGHVKWGANRTFVTEIVEAWNNLSDMFSKDKKIPMYEYINDNDENSMKILSTIFLCSLTKRYSDITDGVNLSEEDFSFNNIDKENILPKIIVDENQYELNGLDILESFAKFEEALLANAIENKNINEVINPAILEPRYYIALYYFIDKVGIDRLLEFPLVCELSLAFYHLPRINDENSLKNNHPGWRFVKIVDYLSENTIELDLGDNDSFWIITSKILKDCGYEDWDVLWNHAEKYAKASDLKISVEMLDAIAFKKNNPWCLSYPMFNPSLFFSAEFLRFNPLFVITNNCVFYNTENVKYEEILIENEIQSLALQIIGEKSQYNIYPNTLQCADNYFGLKTCKHYINNTCDGHICNQSEIPELHCDENGNIIDGCVLEIFLNSLGTSIKSLLIGHTNKRYSLKEIGEAVKRLNIPRNDYPLGERTAPPLRW